MSGAGTSGNTEYPLAETSQAVQDIACPVQWPANVLAYVWRDAPVVRRRARTVEAFRTAWTVGIGQSGL